MIAPAAVGCKRMLDRVPTARWLRTRSPPGRILAAVNCEDYHIYVSDPEVDRVRKAREHGTPGLAMHLGECKRIGHDARHEHINRRGETATKALAPGLVPRRASRTSASASGRNTTT